MKIQTIQEIQVLDDVKLYKSKLSGMKDHLEALLKKKIRLETEITLLRKSIKDKEKSFAFKMKNKVNLESSVEQPKVVELENSDYYITLPSDWSQEVLTLFEEFCQITQDIEEMLEFYSEK